MPLQPIQPLPPVGPWIDTYRGYIRAHGVRVDTRAASLTEAHVGWYLSALLLDPALDDRARAAVRRVFFDGGVATLVPSDPPSRSSEARVAVDAPRVAAWRSEDEETEDDEEVTQVRRRIAPRRGTRSR